MFRILRWAALGAALSLTALAPASAQEIPATTVDSLSATRSGSTIGVSGTATFTAPAVEVATDATGDHALSGIPAPSGTDLETASIRAVSPSTLRFTLEIADLPTTDRGTPELVNYNWPFTIGENNLDLNAHGQATANTIICSTGLFLCEASPDDLGKPSFVVNRCQPNETGGESCESTNATGTVTGTSFTWDLPTSMLGATSGDTLATRGTIAASASASGATWYTNGNAGDTMFQESDFELPTPLVSIGIAPAGTADEDVPLTSTVTAGANGTFSAALVAPASPGDYVVAARACFGDGNCDLSSTTITIA